MRALCETIVRSKEPLQPRVATNVTVVDERGAAIDRGLAIFFPAPHSYTGEDVLELHVHGSPVVAREVVRALIACGARAAQPGDFTRRALLAGKMDLHAAAAVADLIDAETRSAARAALANLGGGLASEVRDLRTALTAVLEELAGAIDFPEEVPEPDPGRLVAVLDRLAAALERLRHDGEIGVLVREGVGVAIVGPPNAGKSSLLNALLGSERAIVSDEPGTTRDTIEETIAIDGVPVRLVDTAGIRAHADRLEAAGIERTRHALASARVAVVVIDGSVPLSAEALGILELTLGRERVVLVNKGDLGDAGVGAALRQAQGDKAQDDGDAAGGDAVGGDEVVLGSVRDSGTLAALRGAIARVGWHGERPDLERAHLASAREFDAVNEALDAIERARATLGAGEPSDLCAGELQRAFSALGHVSDRIAAEEVLDGIFSRFCIGK